MILAHNQQAAGGVEDLVPVAHVDHGQSPGEVPALLGRDRQPSLAQNSREEQRIFQEVARFSRQDESLFVHLGVIQLSVNCAAGLLWRPFC